MKQGLLVLASGLVLLAPRAAWAQDRAEVSGLGGLTFGSGTGANIAGGAGVNVNPYIEVSGEIGHLSNLLPSAAATDITAQASHYASAVGDTVASAAGTLQATTVLGLVRVQAGPSRSLRPFFEAGLGVARLTGTLSATMTNQALGVVDISSQVTEPILTGLPATDRLMTLGGGMIIGAGPHAGVEIGYRYGRVFSTTHINSSRVYAGLEIGF